MHVSYLPTVQKHLTFSVFPCILRQVGAVWLRQNIDPLEDTEMRILKRIVAQEQRYFVRGGPTLYKSTGKSARPIFLCFYRGWGRLVQNSEVNHFTVRSVLCIIACDTIRAVS